jgi:probable HAF family extracellular repeat protein
MPRLLSRLAPPLIALLLILAAHAQTTYDVVLLPAKVGDVGLSDAGLNNRGSVIVSAGRNPNYQGYLWRNGKLIALPALGGTGTLASGLGELDRVVGGAHRQDNLDYHAALWRNGQVLDVEPTGAVKSGALRINRLDQLVGYYTDAAGITKAYQWMNGSIVELGNLGGSATYPLGTNDAGDIVGQSDISNIPDPKFRIPPTHAFLWQAGTMTDLGSIFGADFNYATHIDNSGRILGTADLAGDGSAHAFLWISGQITDLPPFSGDLVSWGDSMNRAGQIVGSSGMRENGFAPFQVMRCPCHALLWENGQPIDLNTRIAAKWDLDFATSINDNGEILAHTIKPFSAPVLLVPQQGNHPVASRHRETGPYVGPRQLQRDRLNGIAEVW